MRRINPHVAPDFYFEKARIPRREDAKKVREEKKEPEKDRPKTIVPSRLTGVAALIAAIGAPGVEHLEYAQGLLAYLSPEIRAALGDPLGAQSVMLGCLIDAELTHRGRQLGALEAMGLEELARKSEVIAPHLRNLDRAYRLPLVALAIPPLKGLDEAARAKFLEAMRATMQADQRLTLSEFVLATILDWTLGPEARRAGGVRFQERAELAAEVALVLSLLVHAGATENAACRAAFDKAKETLAMPALALAARDTLALAQVAASLERLSGLPPAEKERLLEGFAAAVAADDNVRLMEHELLRAVACVLDCPMPPALGALDPRLLRK